MINRQTSTSYRALADPRLPGYPKDERRRRRSPQFAIREKPVAKRRGTRGT